jgi:hypothetical protein
MVMLPKPEAARTTPFVVAPGVSGSMMIGLVEEPRTVRLPPPPTKSIHHSDPCSLKRTGPDPYIELKKNKSLLAWLDYLVYVFYETKSEWESECTGFDGDVFRAKVLHRRG